MSGNPINISGENLEREVKHFLNGTKLPYKKSPKGKNGDIDFIVYDGNKSMYIECHNQNGKGSVDEKIPHKIWKYWNKYKMGEIWVVKGKHNRFGKGIVEHLEWMSKECNISINLVTLDELKSVLNKCKIKQNPFF